MTGTNVQQTLLDEYASFPATPPIILTGAAKLPNGAFQFAFTNHAGLTNYITTNITTTIITNWSTRGPPRITGYTTNITTTLTTNRSENTVTVLTTTESAATIDQLDGARHRDGQSAPATSNSATRRRQTAHCDSIASLALNA